jgi:hypothetical protein
MSEDDGTDIQGQLKGDGATAIFADHPIVAASITPGKKNPAAVNLACFMVQIRETTKGMMLINNRNNRYMKR